MPTDAARDRQSEYDPDRPPTRRERERAALRREAERNGDPVPPLGMAYDGRRMR